MSDLYERLAEMARRGSPAVVATVIRTEGSTPRAAGAKMVIAANGRTWGTVGGGTVEANVIRQAASVLEAGVPRIEIYELDEGEAGVGSLCGGRMEVFLEPLPSPDRLYIFGAGHVARPVAELAKALGFAVTVIDPRPELANGERFPSADEILVEDFTQAADRIPLGGNAYVVVVTPKHEHDEAVVRALLGKPCRYIGMIGSRKKVAVVVQRLRESGFPEEQIQSLHSPIGMDIGAETPEEIAVSILAELVACRRGRETPAGRGRA